MRGSVELPNNNIASPALNKSSSLPNINSQSTQNPSIAPKDIPNPQVNAASNAITLSKTQQESVRLQTQKNASIDALWAKLQNRPETQFITGGTTKESSSAEKMAIMRQNIEQYKYNMTDASLVASNLPTQQNKEFKSMSIEALKSMPKLPTKDTKVIEFAAKALEALEKGNIKSANIKTAYKYLERIDNVDNPGLLEQATKLAKDKILQQASKLAQNILKSPATNQQQKNEKPGAATNRQQQNEKPGTATSIQQAIIAAKNIGSDLTSKQANHVSPQPGANAIIPSNKPRGREGR